MERLLEKIADHLRESEFAFDTALTLNSPVPLTRAEKVSIEAANETRLRLVDDVDKVVSVLRKIK